MSKYTKLFEELLEVATAKSSKARLTESGDISGADRAEIAKAGAKIIHKIVVEMSRDLLDEFEDDMGDDEAFGDDGMIRDTRDRGMTDKIHRDQDEIDAEHTYGSEYMDTPASGMDDDLEDRAMGLGESLDEVVGEMTDDDFQSLKSALDDVTDSDSDEDGEGMDDEDGEEDDEGIDWDDDSDEDSDDSGDDGEEDEDSEDDDSDDSDDSDDDDVSDDSEDEFSGEDEDGEEGDEDSEYSDDEDDLGDSEDEMSDADEDDSVKGDSEVRTDESRRSNVHHLRRPSRRK